MARSHGTRGPTPRASRMSRVRVVRSRVRPMVRMYIAHVGVDPPGVTAAGRRCRLDGRRWHRGSIAWYPGPNPTRKPHEPCACSPLSGPTCQCGADVNSYWPKPKFEGAKRDAVVCSLGKGLESPGRNLGSFIECKLFEDHATAPLSPLPRNATENFFVENSTADSTRRFPPSWEPGNGSAASAPPRLTVWSHEGGVREASERESEPPPARPPPR